MKLSKKIIPAILFLLILFLFFLIMKMILTFDPECIIPARKENIFRILNIGDSITRGIMTSNPKYAFPSLLQ